MPWCRYLAARGRVQPQVYADHLKCVSRDPVLLLSAARFNTGYFRLVGQELAPRKCVLLSTSRVVRKDMKEWVLSQEGDKWSVKFDVRDLGCIWTLPFVDGLRLLASRVRLVISRFVLIFALPLDFHGRGLCFCLLLSTGLRPLCLLLESLRKLRSSIHRVVWSRRQPLASVGAVLSLLDGPTGCDPAFVWCGLGSACFVGILLFGPLRLVGFTVFLKWRVRVVLGTVLSIFCLPVPLRLVFGGFH